MKPIKTFAAIIATMTMLAAFPGHAKLTRDQRISDARAMISLFEHRYAPAIWKSEYLDIDLDVIAATLLGEAYKQDMTDEDFYAAMARMSGSVKDTHNWFLIPSSYYAYLDFGCDYVEGRYLIKHVNRQSLGNDVFPFERGDEIISMDGVPVWEIIEDLAKFDSQGNDLTEKRFLAGNLAYRPQKFFAHVPEGKVDVEIFSRLRGESQIVTLEWKHGGKPLAEAKSAAPYQQSSMSLAAEIPLKNARALADLENLRWSAVIEDKAHAMEDRIGDLKPFFPLWENFKILTEYPLFTGMFKLGGHNFGFIRIPTWSPQSPMAWLELMTKIIPRLEQETEALLIDQTNNGGGLICLADIMSGFFVSTPIPNLKFQIRANRKRSELYEAYVLQCEKQKKDSKECRAIIEIANELRRALAEGDSLTKGIDICGGDGMIHSVQDKSGRKYVYQKPLLILVNEWSISAADMFPAPLQDSGRAKIFGERTCGAGGSVITTEYLGYSDFRVSQTETLAQREKETIAPNGVSTRYIENVGVTPDIHYSITTDDFLNNYSGYIEAVEKALLEMIR